MRLTGAVLAAAACSMLGVAAAAVRPEPKQPSAAVRAAQAWLFPGLPKPDPTAPKLSPSLRVQAPGSTRTYTVSQLEDPFFAPDWFPNEHPPAPHIVEFGQKPTARPCGVCHGMEGDGDAVTPALAGLPEAYILEQLEAFRSGERSAPASFDAAADAVMHTEVQHLNESDFMAAAAYFSGLAFRSETRTIEARTVPETRSVNPFAWRLAVANAPRAPIGERIIEVNRTGNRLNHDAIAYVPPGSLERGKRLAMQGDGKVKACASCHGMQLQGLGPIPPLAGRSPNYLVREMILFQTGGRRNPQALPMVQEASGLTMREMLSASAYIASLQPEAGGGGSEVAGAQK